MKKCFVLVLSTVLWLAGCSEIQPLSEAEQVERLIEQEIARNERGLNALTAAAEVTAYDGFAWRRGERIQIRNHSDTGMQLVEDAEAPTIIAAAVEYNIPSFSIVRYEGGWLVVFRNYLSDYCQAVYAYAYRGELPNTPLCSSEQFATNANGSCQRPINSEWAVFKEWFFAEALVAEGNPVCVQQAEQGWLPRELSEE